jgi:hypothetical protein
VVQQHPVQPFERSVSKQGMLAKDSPASQIQLFLQAHRFCLKGILSCLNAF